MQASKYTSSSPHKIGSRTVAVATPMIDVSQAAQHILSDESKTIGLLRAPAYLTEALNRQPQAADEG